MSHPSPMDNFGQIGQFQKNLVQSETIIYPSFQGILDKLDRIFYSYILSLSQNPQGVKKIVHLVHEALKRRTDKTLAYGQIFKILSNLVHNCPMKRGPQTRAPSPFGYLWKRLDFSRRCFIMHVWSGLQGLRRYRINIDGIFKEFTLRLLSDIDFLHFRKIPFDPLFRSILCL